MILRIIIPKSIKILLMGSSSSSSKKDISASCTLFVLDALNYTGTLLFAFKHIIYTIKAYPSPG